VAVNGHRLHVYSEGSGEPTLVFMSGSGTTAPTLDFRGLYRRLATNYRVVVVERAGYGWSDDSDTPAILTPFWRKRGWLCKRPGKIRPTFCYPIR
jgi:pimeloyl-ACP methyl ester carboxylesterase